MRCVRMLLGFMVLLAFVVLSMAVSLSAQTASTSTVTGTVSDKTGAAVPNAKVDLEDVGTKARLSATTGGDGNYIFPNRPWRSERQPPSCRRLYPSLLTLTPFAQR